MYFREMTKPIVISQKEARKLVLNAQGLNQSFDNSLDIIKQLSYIQIDTISVKERAHNHVFFSRNSNFKKEEINQLMSDKSIFEYWSHAAAYLPIEDYKFSLYPKEKYRSGGKHWFPRDKKVENYVLDKIFSEGPLQSKDFDSPKNKNHEWYEWKPAKIALTNLFMDGSIMITNRKSFQKIFDLTDRVIPKLSNIQIPTVEEYCEHLIINAIKSQGIVSLNEICYLRKGIKPIVKKILNQLIEAEEIVEVLIENNFQSYYSAYNYQKLNTNNQVQILSPFDNLIIQRKRIKEIFNFDYQIECYVPEKKRKYGYYTLPVLFGNKFVVRFDAKADRKTKLFTIKGLWFEEEFKPTDEFYKMFSKQIRSFSIFCGCEKIKLESVYPNNLKKRLKSII